MTFQLSLPETAFHHAISHQNEMDSVNEALKFKENKNVGLNLLTSAKKLNLNLKIDKAKFKFYQMTRNNYRT